MSPYHPFSQAQVSAMAPADLPVPPAAVVSAAFVALILRELGEDEFPDALFSLSLVKGDDSVFAQDGCHLAQHVHAGMSGEQLLAGVAKALSPMAKEHLAQATWQTLRIEWRRSAYGDEALCLTLVNAAQFAAACELGGRLAACQQPAWVAKHFFTLLQAFAEPSLAMVPLQSVPLVGDGEERQHLLHRVACPDVDPSLLRHETLAELFAASAKAFAGRPALQYMDQVLSYAQLASATDQLASQLVAQGIGPGSLVGLFLERSSLAVQGLLAILKAGAAYVPLDPDYPADRVQYILQNSRASLLLTQTRLATELKNQLGEAPCPFFCIDAAPPPVAPVLARVQAATATDLAYVIYTSGSTGRPKGVEIEHRSACHFVRAEAKVFGLTPEDRVYQGFSLAFDASVEELWLAFAAGACLVVASREVSFATQELAGFLNEQQITVFSTVPTVLSAMEGTLASVRLLILGGEAATESLIERWSTGGRRLINSYGPTEATVVATYQDCQPGERISIGKALPNLETYILSDDLALVPTGAVGELCLGGPCLARGYLGQEALTQEKFPAHPFRPGERLYRSGDLVRFDGSGAIEFIGRRDAQVKLRGYRVELAEIEAVLATCPGVQQAAVAMRRSAYGIDQLVGYIVCAPDQSFAKAAALPVLKERLAPFMIPNTFQQLASLPRLPSGKLDRARLPAPAASHPVPPAPAATAFTSDIERDLHATWAELFAPAPVGTSDDFFELGGHSLLAARLISILRRDQRFARLSVLDIYTLPTIKGLSARVEELLSQHRGRISHHNRLAEKAVDQQARRRCGLWQLLCLYLLAALATLPMVGAVELFLGLDHDGASWPTELGVLGGASLVLWPAYMLLAVASKWLLIGRFRAGSYPLWGSYYRRFWLVQRIGALVPLAPLRGTLLLNWYYRLMGASIGNHVHLASHYVQIYDLLELKDGASIGQDAQLLGYYVKDQTLVIGPISVGAAAYVGTKAMVGPNCVLGDDASLSAMSLLGAGGTIPAGDTWAGSPARSVVGARRPLPEQEAPSQRRRLAFTTLHAAVIALTFLLFLSASAPLAYAFTALAEAVNLWTAIVLTPVMVALLLALICLVIVLLKWLLVGRMRPRLYRIMTLEYLGKWSVELLMHLHLQALHSQYATLYLIPWLRLLGAKIGKRVEISTASHIACDLLTIGDESFIADSACLGAPSYHHGITETAPSVIGKRTFIGNSALVPIGATIADNCLVGCLSVPPLSPAARASADSSWLGSPAMLLPRRQAAEAFSDEQTFHPRWPLYLCRLAIEFFRITLPPTLAFYLAAAFVECTLYLNDRFLFIAVLALLPVAGLALTVVAVAITILVKWLLVGRLKPGQHPLWSLFIWRNELVTALHESFAAPALINALQGTPFIAWYFRALGATIGRGVFMETTQLTEFDLVHIGDHACLNANCTIQTHLFEDRIFKMSTLTIGDHAAVGAMAVVLYDSTLGEGSSIDGLSLVMKGETLPDGTAWAGIPAQRRYAAPLPATDQSDVKSKT